MVSNGKTKGEGVNTCVKEYKTNTFESDGKKEFPRPDPSSVVSPVEPKPRYALEKPEQKPATAGRRKKEKEKKEHSDMWAGPPQTIAVP